MALGRLAYRVLYRYAWSPEHDSHGDPLTLDVGSTCTSLAFESLHPSIVCSITCLYAFVCVCLLARVELCENYSTDFHDILWRGGAGPKDQMFDPRIVFSIESKGVFNIYIEGMFKGLIFICVQSCDLVNLYMVS